MYIEIYFIFFIQHITSNDFKVVNKFLIQYIEMITLQQLLLVLIVIWLLGLLGGVGGALINFLVVLAAILFLLQYFGVVVW